MASWKSPMVPIICLDNLDFEESVHEKSVEKTTQMFHGTWGYLHVPNKELIDQFDPEEFSLERYQKAILDLADMQVQPSWFLPSNDSSLHFQDVIKSQITKVLLEYIATPLDKNQNLNTFPPPIDPIAVKKPNFLMFKLMVALDNSSKGVGEVLEGFLRQTKISSEQFFSRLQVLEGNLATCMNLESLRAQQKPSSHIQDNLSGFFSLLGASHVLWNFRPGRIPSEQLTTKKYFTLMLTHMTKCHEATIIYCILTVMNLPKALLPEEKAKLPSQRLKETVDLCYNQFFSPVALRSASVDLATGLKNNLLWLRDFAAIIECDRAMRAGDIGRVLNMWKCFTVMAHGIKGLNNYAIYLPRMILLLTKVLPKGLAKTLLHSLLINPSGRPNHFVAKDFFLENNNFWLKYFYNHSGIGTEISRLKDIFLVIIPILRKLVQGIKGNSGKNVLSWNGPTTQFTLQIIYVQLKDCVDIYKAGLAALHKDYQQKKKKLNRMQPLTILLYHTPTVPIEEANMFEEEEEDIGDLKE
ncbi:hypothetical protein PTTG_26233 [Puccinia triticina 1-1 BBBD Race 1]|uniref:DUF6589 domain-containing protein n=1 Tax=Puccinia triticina (isolate 1-1 / race 1 (BBBD)) TaxID=630390 RepID=A0A180GVA4_PUCT1|nr:hypothetical protein PTTG_26233 [Puccinia triticina 1-1 BBBD Race 1]